MWAPFSCCRGVYLCERNHISITNSNLRILWSVLAENRILKVQILWTSHFLPCFERDLAPMLRHPQLSFFLQSAQSSLLSQKEAKQICNAMDASFWLDNDDQADCKKKESWGCATLVPNPFQSRGENERSRGFKFQEFFFSQGQTTKYVGPNR